MRTKGATIPKVELGRDFCTMHLPQVSSSYVYSFGSYRVDKTDKQTHTHIHTNKQTPLKTFNALCYATTLSNKTILITVYLLLSFVNVKKISETSLIQAF